jgi:putative addiction module CopG family antidote
MTINLPPELEKLVLEKVNRGEYDSADALVEEALQRLIEDDANQNEIRARIEAAEAEIDRGEFAEYHGSNIHELAREIHESGLQRLATERNKLRIPSELF